VPGQQGQCRHGHGHLAALVYDHHGRSRVGVVAVQRGTRLFPNPEPDFRLEEDDVLVVLGTREQLDDFESIVSAQVPGGA